MKQFTEEPIKQYQEKILRIFLEHPDKFVEKLQVECNEWNSEGIPEKYPEFEGIS